MKHVYVVMGLFILFTPVVLAAEGELPEFHNKVDISDKESLQRGVRIFVNYCMGCHSAAYMRYNRLGKDLGISEDVLKSNLMFGAEKTGDTMDIAMKGDDGKTFFGVAPPDLSVVARARGADWLYAYFMGFYLDPDRPFGVNNLVFKDVAMPHVLWELQGFQRPVYKTVVHEGIEYKEIDSLEQDSEGRYTPEEYEQTIHDLVNFLVYLSEPAKFQRQRVGIWVILYLLAFTVLAYLLKKDYWKDVH